VFCLAFVICISTGFRIYSGAKFDVSGLLFLILVILLQSVVLFLLCQFPRLTREWKVREVEGFLATENVPLYVIERVHKAFSGNPGYYYFSALWPKADNLKYKTDYRSIELKHWQMLLQFQRQIETLSVEQLRGELNTRAYFDPYREIKRREKEPPYGSNSSSYIFNYYWEDFSEHLLASEYLVRKAAEEINQERMEIELENLEERRKAASSHVARHSVEQRITTVQMEDAKLAGNRTKESHTLSTFNGRCVVHFLNWEVEQLILGIEVGNYSVRLEDVKKDIGETKAAVVQNDCEPVILSGWMHAFAKNDTELIVAKQGGEAEERRVLW
jgi:hypothetical protein